MLNLLWHTASMPQSDSLWKFKVAHYPPPDELDNDFPLAIGRDLDGLDMRIEDRPLTFPIAAHVVASVDVATFHSFCPNDGRDAWRRDALDVAAIKEVIHSF